MTRPHRDLICGAVTLGTAVLLIAAPALAQQGATAGEWRYYAGDNGSTKYSPLDQIDAQNFSRLEVKWRWDTPDNALMRARNIRPPSPPAFKATPLMVDGTIYVSTGLGQMAALDARTGEQRWLYDPEMYARVVAVDCDTGKRAWHFQAIHHGVWDWDFPAAPNLVDVTVDGRPIKAIAQVSKQAFTYVFDRATGEPVWPIEERPVPQSDIPGERLSPTQPFPTRPPPFDQQGVSIDDLIGFTPALRQEAIDIVRRRFGPMFTPPSLYKTGGPIGTIQVPPNAGAASWTGAGIDPDTGYLYVPSRTGHHMVILSEPGSDVTNLRYVRAGTVGPGSEHPDSPQRPRGPRGLQLFQPPYSRMTAIDLNTGDIAWQVPTGPGSDFIRNHEALQGLDLPPLGGNGRGGPLVTKTLLIHSISLGPQFDASPSDASAGLVAYDKATGDVLSEVDLPGAVVGTPMTYMLDGTQYIAMTVQTNPPSLIALALP